MNGRLRRLANCGVCAAACLAGICSPVAACGQIYSVRRSAAVTPPHRYCQTEMSVPRLEIYAGPVLSLQPLRDRQNFTVSDFFTGAAAGIGLRVYGGLYLGAEGQYFPRTRLDVPFTAYVRQRAFYLTARWNLTPDTLPPLLLEAGAGTINTSFKMQLYSGPEERLNGRAFFVGAGTALYLGKGWTVSPSLRLLYMQKTDFDFLLRYASRRGWQAVLFLSKGF